MPDKGDKKQTFGDSLLSGNHNFRKLIGEFYACPNKCVYIYENVLVLISRI